MNSWVLNVFFDFFQKVHDFIELHTKHIGPQASGEAFDTSEKIYHCQFSHLFQLWVLWPSAYWPFISSLMDIFEADLNQPLFVMRGGPCINAESSTSSDLLICPLLQSSTLESAIVRQERQVDVVQLEISARFKSVICSSGKKFEIGAGAG